MSVKFGDSNIGAEIGTPSLNASITKPSINVNFNAPALGASGGNTILRELVNPQFFIGTVTTLEPGEDVYCYLTGTKDAPVLNFGIPMGYKGETGADGADGADGQAATIAVGSVSTGLPTDPASVTNSGTSSAAVFDFVIPKGDKGDTGATGATGAGVASGGTTGQVLKKKSSTNYDTEWGAVEAVPQGGTTGQVLAKKTNTDFDIEWIDPPDGTVTDVTVNGTSVVTSGVAEVTVPEPAPTSGATPSTDTQYGSVGTSTQYAREDHRHTSNFPTTGTPADLGTAANGTSATYAHSDHVHNYPTIVHVGDSAPSDSNIEVWLDTDEQGASVVTSVDGQSGAVTVLPQGGSTGDVLSKKTGTDYDVEWTAKPSLLFQAVNCPATNLPASGSYTATQNVTWTAGYSPLGVIARYTSTGAVIASCYLSNIATTSATVNVFVVNFNATAKNSDVATVSLVLVRNL